MGKNRDIESLIRLIVNTVVHKIVIKHTNRPESKHFLASEIAEYRGQTENIVEQYNWNDKDKEYIKEKVLKKVGERLAFKYSDIKSLPHEVKKLVEEEIKSLGF
jgi:hypothetical protein